MGLDATSKGAGETERDWGRPIRRDAAVEERVAGILAAIAAARRG
jgi:4-hydroxy-3-polyprenylbenzoate decarboxylase